MIDPKVVEALVAARSRGHDSPLDHLTPREREVLAEMAQGRNNAGIAAALGLSERAVEKHINSLFSKLGLSEEPDVAPPGEGRAALPRRPDAPTRGASTPPAAGWPHPGRDAGRGATMAV